jgi:hypothetical protein
MLGDGFGGTALPSGAPIAKFVGMFGASVGGTAELGGGGGSVGGTVGSTGDIGVI